MKRGIIMVLIWTAVAAGFSAVVMILWNLLVPQIFGLAFISFWQAMGLLALSRILFGRFGFGRMMMHGRKGHIHDHWMKMTPEQRREFIDRRRRFGFGAPFGMEACGNGKHEDPANER